MGLRQLSFCLCDFLFDVADFGDRVLFVCIHFGRAPTYFYGLAGVGQNCLHGCQTSFLRAQYLAVHFGVAVDDLLVKGVQLLLVFGAHCEARPRHDAADAVVEACLSYLVVGEGCTADDDDDGDDDGECFGFGWCWIGVVHLRELGCVGVAAGWAEPGTGGRGLSAVWAGLVELGCHWWPPL